MSRASLIHEWPFLFLIAVSVMAPPDAYAGLWEDIKSVIHKNTAPGTEPLLTSSNFETNAGELAWVAQVYPDETFDFSMRFLDAFGHPSIQLDCT